MHEQEKELFAGYEIKNWNITTRIYKIIGVSAIINLLFIFTTAQGNLLTRKGCDSPLVGSICQVLDTVVLGGELLGTDSAFVSTDYEKTELEDADITYIDVSNDSPPLNYPEGYFALANPEQFAMMQDPSMMTATTIPEGFGGFSGTTVIPPASGSSDLLASTPNLPPVNPSPIVGDLPTSTGGTSSISSNRKSKRYKIPFGINTKPSKIQKDSSKELPKLGGEETAENKAADKPKPEKTPEAQKAIDSQKVADVVVNKKPFENLGDALNDKLAKNEVDLNKNFTVVLSGTINDDGTFDSKKTGFVKSDGDQGMVDVAKLALEAVGDSGILKFLKQNGVDKVSITLAQDENQITATVLSEQKTAEKAQTVLSLVNIGLQWMKFADNTGAKKLDENSKTLLTNSKVSSEGRNFLFKFDVPKPVGQDLIKKSLADRAEKKSSNQPDSNNGLSQNTQGKTGK